MTPDEATRTQITRYRQMTGEERLSVALRLHELACAMAREGIRRQHPGASADEVEQLLRQRLEFARGA
jgi:type II secretory pathway predicted ATPase ExeA